MPPRYSLSCFSWLFCVPDNFCLLSLLIACMLDVRVGKWLSVVSNHSTLTPSVSVTMWPCVCHLPCLIFLSLFFHSSVTMTAGWERGEGGWWRWTGSWTENVEFGEQILCLPNAKEVRGHPSVDTGSPGQHTLLCSKLRENCDSQLLKNVSHLTCARPCASPLQRTNAYRHTSAIATADNDACLSSSIWLLFEGKFIGSPKWNKV